MSVRKRLDLLLVEKGLADSLTKAQAIILAGEVIVNDKLADKPGAQFGEDALIRLRNIKMPYVSRGGLKLKAALDKWPTTIKGSVCIDVGASTGGFTDLLLKEGAQRVYAVDVGYNQLAYALRKDPRVRVMEKTHILQLDAKLLDPQPSIAVIDVSFISLTSILTRVCELLTTPAIIYALIKPQFEVAAAFVEKGGIVRDENARLHAVNSVIAFAQKIALQNNGYIESPIKGADGNVEYLIALIKSKG